MGSNRFPWLFWMCVVFVSLFLKSHCASSELIVNFLKTPVAVSPLNSATIQFEVLDGKNAKACGTCTICKLDDSISSDCHTGIVYYSNLADGRHRFEVCSKGCQGFTCAHYNWTIDTVPPTAYLRASTHFTNALNVSVYISFSEPCTGGGGFVCSTVDSCKLLVYGAGQVLPSTLAVIQPSIEYSILVSLSSNVQYGDVSLMMDKNFCTDTAGNIFTRTANSNFSIHFDRRAVVVNLTTGIPETQLSLDSGGRTVQATNNLENLKVYLNFSEPVLNSSAEVLNALNTSEGSLLPSSGSSLGNRSFEFLIVNISKTFAVINISVDSKFIISRLGTPISPVEPVTLVYDSERPSVRLTTTSKMRTREKSILISIVFTKAIFGFDSSHLSISGGQLESFREVSKSIYCAYIKAVDKNISVIVPENTAWDVAGNKNLQSNDLEVRHYSVPIISSALSTFATASFGLTSLASVLLTVSIASLQSAGAFSMQSSFSMFDPAKDLFSVASHIQLIALSGWLPVPLPIEYYEFTRGLEWAIPYFSVPWETMHPQPMMTAPAPSVISRFHASSIHNPGLQNSIQLHDESSDMAASDFGSPLSRAEYISSFESRNKPEAEDISKQDSTGWRDFWRTMFWLAVIDGSLILLHSVLLLILKFRNNGKDGYGALTFPRFEIFLAVYSLPPIAKASTSLIKGGPLSGVIVGLCVVSFCLLALFLFLSIGIIFGKLLEYKEIRREGQTSHWYREIVRIALGPGKRGQWTWKSNPNSDYLTIFGPLFEDLRGPPKYNVSQIAGSNSDKRGDRIIASNVETEDAEASFIQKLFGILRVYYPLLEPVKSVSLAIITGARSESSNSKSPAITLSITSFQLFFLVLTKPFIQRRRHLFEIISVASEVGVFAFCVVISKKKFSSGEEDTKNGIFMNLLSLVGILPKMINQWIALYSHTKKLDPSRNSFLSGLKTASLGFVLVFIPKKCFENLGCRFPVDQSGDGETGLSADRRRSSGSRNSGNTGKPRMKPLRELTKASSSEEESSAPNDPSGTHTT